VALSVTQPERLGERHETHRARDGERDGSESDDARATAKPVVEQTTEPFQEQPGNGAAGERAGKQEPDRDVWSPRARAAHDQPTEEERRQPDPDDGAKARLDVLRSNPFPERGGENARGASCRKANPHDERSERERHEKRGERHVPVVEKTRRMSQRGARDASGT
jgi:hypothetical protein